MPTASMSPFALIACTGMCGVGKTTWTRALAAALPAGVLEESPEANPWLTAYTAALAHGQRAEDVRRLSFPLQLHYLVSGAADRQRARQAGGCWVTDQATAVGRAVFVDGALEDGRLTAMEHARLLSTQAALRAAGDPDTPTVLLVLTAPIATCLERLRTRARPHEATVPVAYWERVAERYAQAIAAQRAAAPDRVLLVDTTVTSPRDPLHIEAIAASLRARLALATSLAASVPARVA